ncbi:MAG: serine/threonine protein kinase, partial [Muribaculaceae bacterium]|nr:serine/threonine protein kinase [Muribaculaceae bacterium]
MTPKYSLRKGTKILNRYEILRYISSGGFGITYEAFDLLSKRRIAIKELYITEICNRESDAITVTINDTNKPTFFAHRRKFLDEAKRLMELSHPNIIKVSDVFEANGTAYFAMDYIEGKPLSKEVVPMSENIAISIINPILDALEYIHNKGVLHLDIKPSNIMIDKHGKVILIDFGTSKVYGDADGKSLSLSTTLAFTPGYAPLEQMSVSTVKNLGTYSDIYAIGATLYYLLSGCKPLLPGEILENDEKLPRIENITTETQNTIWQATKVVRTTRIATVEQLRRALAGEIIDVKAEELQRKEEKRRRREEIERHRKQEEERRRREEIERRRKQEEEERRRREEIERRRKQEEERRRRE